MAPTTVYRAYYDVIPGLPLGDGDAACVMAREGLRFAASAGWLRVLEDALGRTATLLGDAPTADWTLVVDDDVELPTRFLDRFLGVCEHLSLALAQPAQTLASQALDARLAVIHRESRRNYGRPRIVQQLR